MSAAGSSFSFWAPIGPPRREASKRLVGGQPLENGTLGFTTGMSLAGCDGAAAAAPLARIAALITNSRRIVSLLRRRALAEPSESPQTVKLSPQPQEPMALGFSNTNKTQNTTSFGSDSATGQCGVVNVMVIVASPSSEMSTS